jgi:Bacterial Ig-like domain (group 3).
MRKLIVILIIVLAAAAFLPACTKERGVEKVQIVENSFKSDYALDEALSLSRASLLVTYSDGTTSTVKITEDMVRGFSSTAPGSGKITVSFGGKTAVFAYTVSAATNVDTTFRLTLSSALSENDSVDVTVESLRTEEIGSGFLAVSFNVTLSGCSNPTISSLMGPNFSIRQKPSGNGLSVVVWSTDGNTPASVSGRIAKITVVKTPSAEVSKVILSNIVMSDGIRDYKKIPDYVLEI